MRRNVMLRTASGLFVVTLLSVSIVSSTFAKYVTSSGATDTARVAKFGVIVEADGTLFSDTYKTTYNSPGESGQLLDSATLSVVSSNVEQSNYTTTKDGIDGDDRVVAPGTKNETGLTFSVQGTPEVAVQVEFSIDDGSSDVWLGKGTYPNMTNGNVFDGEYIEVDDVFQVDTAYYPIKYTLTQIKKDSNGKDTTPIKVTGSLNDIINALNSKDFNQTYDANTDLSTQIGTLTLTWEWVYDDKDTQDISNKEDTLLGDLATIIETSNIVDDAISKVNIASNTTTLVSPIATKSASVVAVDGCYSINANLGITITVTQVD